MDIPARDYHPYLSRIKKALRDSIAGPPKKSPAARAGQGKKTLTEIAQENGFNNAGHFSAFFSGLSGISIRDYLTEIRLSRAKRYLRWRDETGFRLSVKDIATKKLGFSGKSALAHLFRYHVGETCGAYRKRVSVISYGTEVKIEKGAGLLERTDNPIGDIASEVGMSWGGFLAAFKRIKGITPREYRERVRPVSFAMLEKVEEAVKLLEGTDYTIKDIASRLRMTELNFQEVFKKVTDKTPSEYRKRVRPVSLAMLKKVEEGAELLRGTDDTVKDIASRLGMPKRTFYHVFKEVMGETPSQFRERVRQTGMGMEP